MEYSLIMIVKSSYIYITKVYTHNKLMRHVLCNFDASVQILGSRESQRLLQSNKAVIHMGGNPERTDQYDRLIYTLWVLA
jgi:hypothetical protein